MPIVAPPFSLLDFCSEIRSAPPGSASTSLDKIRDLVTRVDCSPLSLARVFGSRELDELCLQIGAIEAPTVPLERSGRTTFLVTSLAMIGGHTRLLLDLVRALESEEEVLVLATDILEEGFDPGLDRLLSEVNAKYVAAPKADLFDKLQWLQQQFADLRPSRTFTLLHPFDSVSIAAVQPGLPGELTFIHNFDHNLALGVHLSHARHVDLHAKGLFDCRDIEGLTGNVYWPLVVEDPGRPPERQFMLTGTPTTCCAGGLEKFDRFFIDGVQPHLNEYLTCLPRMMAAGGGRHVHVGPLPDAFLSEIRQALTKASVPPERFEHRPFVADLARMFFDDDIDVYVGSFPIGGGRATLEAEAAGMPLIIHDNYQSAFLSVVDEIYPEAMIWRTVEELANFIAQLTPQLLSHHSKLARRHYERSHHPDLLKNAITGEVFDCPRPHHPLDRLQGYFHLEACVAHMVRSGKLPWSQRS